MPHPDVDAARQAIERTVRALDARGDAGAVRAAVHDDVVIERCGWGEAAGQVVETIRGHDGAVEWMARTPEGTRFRLAAGPEPDGDGWRGRYALEVRGFENGGTWRWRLAGDGRVGWLEHRPDDLDEDMVAEKVDWKAVTADALARIEAGEGDDDHDHDHGSE